MQFHNPATLNVNAPSMVVALPESTGQSRGLSSSALTTAAVNFIAILCAFNSRQIVGAVLRQPQWEYDDFAKVYDIYNCYIK